MSASSTRRNLLSRGGSLLAALGFAGQAVAAHPEPEGEDYYNKLGVTKIINAAGTYTMFTAATMPPQVRAAVSPAAKHPGRLGELQSRAGEYLAKRLQ